MSTIQKSDKGIHLYESQLLQFPLLHSLFRFHLLYVGSAWVLANLHSQETETPDREQPLQVDIITFMFGAKPSETVDMRYVARNLHNKTLYDKAFEVLAMTGNVFLSSGTVKLLATALNDDAHEVRQRSAIILLGHSRNPEAIDVITNSLQNDPSWRVRKSATIATRNIGRRSRGSNIETPCWLSSPTQYSSREYINYYGNEGYHVTNGALLGWGMPVVRVFPSSSRC